MSKKKKSKITKKQMAKAAKKQGNKSMSASFWKNKTLWISGLVVLAITAVVLSPTLNNAFVNWDDPQNLLENPNLLAWNWEQIKAIFTSHVIGNYNPLPIFTFAIEKYLLGYGLDPFGYHLDNLLLHLGCTWLVFRISLMLGLQRWGAVFAALLFGIHPMHVESVAWVTERKDVLYGIFYLGAIFYYIKSLNNPARKWYYFTWILFLFILSGLSKIQAVSLPLSFLCIDYLRRRPLKFGLILEKVPYFIVSLAIGLVGIYFLGLNESLDQSETNFSFIDRLNIGIYSYLIYIIKLFVPYELSPLYPYQSPLPMAFRIVPILFIPYVYGVYKAWIKDMRPLIFGLAFYTVNIMFVLQIVGAGQALLADRFTYIAYIGLFYVMAYYLEKWALQKPNTSIGKAAPYLAGIFILVMSVVSFQQSKIWKNGSTLWTHVIKYYPNTPMPYSNMANYYRDEAKDNTQALTYYNKAIEMKPKASYYNSRGKTYFDMGDDKRAIADYLKGIELDTTQGEIYINLGTAYAKQGNYPVALRYITEGISKTDEPKNGYLNRSLVYYNLQDYPKAIEDHKRYLEYDPYRAEIWYEQGLCLRLIKEYNESITCLNKAIALADKPVNPLFYVERARAAKGAGNQALYQADVNVLRQRGLQIPVDLQ